MSEMDKCPTCGRKMKSKVWKVEILRLRTLFARKTLESIDSVSEKFTDATDLEIYSFLTQIKEMQGIIIRRGIATYLEKRLYEIGYGLKYLLGIIKNENKTHEKRKEYERKYFDRLPPLKKPE